MKRITSLLIIVLTTLSLSAQTQNLYNFIVKTIDGKEFKFSELKGKKIMIVNVASKCGLTPQYEDLQKLYDEFGGDDFVIIGFPANNFGAQEPGSNNEIQEFCQKNYGVTFPIMEKISVKGDDMHPLYKWLTSKAENGKEDSEVTWNFQKYLINEKGELVRKIDPRTSPYSDEIIEWIKKK